MPPIVWECGHRHDSDSTGFVNSWKIRFHRENFCRFTTNSTPQHLVLGLTCACVTHPTPTKDTTLPNFLEKTFVNSHKTLNSFESFPLYNIQRQWNFAAIKCMHNCKWLVPGLFFFSLLNKEKLNSTCSMATECNYILWLYCMMFTLCVESSEGRYH